MRPLEVSYKKSVLKNFAIFTGKQLCLESLFDKVAGPQTCNFIEKRLQRRRIPVHVANLYLFCKTSANGCF